MFNPFYSPSSLSIRASFGVTNTLFLNFELIFLCFTQFGGSSQSYKFDEIRDTELLDLTFEISSAVA